MEVGYTVLYKDGTLVISANPIKQFKKFSIFYLRKNIYKDYGKFDDDNVPWKREYNKIKRVWILNQVKSNCMKDWFRSCYNLTTLIDFQNLDVSECKDFSYMFAYCKSLQELNGLQDWDVSNGKNFSGMFCTCQSLTDISSLQKWDVSNGEYFVQTFCECQSLTDIKLIQNWNMYNGRNFAYMFSDCTLLENINIKNWNLMNEECFAYFCRNCTNLKKIYLPNSINVLMAYIFDNCNPNLKIHWKDKIYTYEDLIVIYIIKKY